jgi:hypothetical protein
MFVYNARPRILFVAVFVVLFLSSLSEGQTRQYLDAPVVKSNIRVRWNPTTKAMEWAADGSGTFSGFQSDTLFLTKRSVYVTYPFLNPLKTQASASAVSVADPAFQTITKLIDALTSVGNIVAPLPSGAQAQASAAAGAFSATGGPCGDPITDLDTLRGMLYGPTTTAEAVGKETKRWVDKIDESFAAGKSGPASIAESIALITASDVYKLDIQSAQDKWNKIRECADSAQGAAKGLYLAVALTNQTARIQQLTALKAAAHQLRDMLDIQYMPPEKWAGANHADYIVSAEIAPTFDKMQTVTVKVVSIRLAVDSTTSLVSVDQQTAGSTAFNVRRYSILTPEIGVGAVFGTVKQPTYGTAKDALGQTIVARAPSKSLSVNPTILVNFVCRCGSGILVPMAQIGAATSKTLPAILLGGGVRLFGLGKGDVAIGGGAMFAWYQDLQKLKVGDVISGTNDINSDLGYISTPKVGGYFALQYKF